LAGGYLRFNSGYLANLPIPGISDQSGEVQGSTERELVEKISKLGRVLSGTQPAVESMEITEPRAEAFVFCLYGFDLHEADKIMQFNGLAAVKREKIMDMMKGLE